MQAIRTLAILSLRNSFRIINW